MEKKKEAFHTALLHDDFSRAGEILEELKEENDFQLLTHLFRNISGKRPLLAEFTGTLPSSISVGPSYSCSHRCSFCFAGFHDKTVLDEKQSHLPAEEFKKLLPWVKSAHTLAFSGGGETLNSPDFFTYLELLGEKKRKELTIDIVTSGTPLNREKIKKLVSMGVQRLSFSVDGRTKLGHGAGEEAYLRKIWSLIDAVQEEKRKQQKNTPKIITAAILAEDNLETLPEYLEEVAEHGVSTVFLSLMVPRNTELYHQSLLPVLPTALKRIREIMKKWENSSLEIILNAHSEIFSQKPPHCSYVSDYAVFYQDMDHPWPCCSTLRIPHKATPEYSIERYWNSFPMRLLRCCHKHISRVLLPVDCKECSVLSVETFAEATTERIMNPEDGLYKGYAEGVHLKNKGKQKEAQILLKETLAEKGEHTTRGRIHLHLCELALMEEKYDEAMDEILQAVHYQFQHRKAFSYLYLLSLLTNREPYLPKR